MVVFNNNTSSFGHIDHFRRSTNPRAKDILYFCFENTYWTSKNVSKVINVFSEQFKNVPIDAFRVLAPNYRDVQGRQILHQRGDFQQQVFQIARPGFITFKMKSGHCGDDDPSLILSADDHGSNDSSQRFSTSTSRFFGRNFNSGYTSEATTVRAQILPSLPDHPEFSRYIFRSLPLDVPQNAQAIVEQAIINCYNHLKQSTHSPNDEDTVNLNEDIISLLRNIDLVSYKNSDGEEHNQYVKKHIMDIIFETTNNIQGVNTNGVYYSGIACIILKNPVTLYNYICSTIILFVAIATFNG
ncbi:hypothetical protein BDA99DRAFT_584697 [Phascolomyces articulosus]|uniref:Uncharacterized protein n=1 Tax=Phascolomyces articulosus TaxID=60185 RepID=A0AAD5KQ58_9FUNG|nr:hypothetical protein BDA99DRAFT_584697 [Phascolomyces articulosus]